MCLKIKFLTFQGSEGLFARRPIPQKSMLCFFSGVRLHTSTWASQRMGQSDYRFEIPIHWKPLNWITLEQKQTDSNIGLTIIDKLASK